MLFAVGAAITAPVYPVYAVGLAIIAGCINEKAPVFAAIYAWNPYMLAGLIPVAIRYFTAPVGTVPNGMTDECEEEVKWVLANPLKIFGRFHRETLSDAFKWVLPWGGLLFALYAPSWPLVVGLVAAYGLCLVATDSQRLYVWAMPLMAAAVAPEYIGFGLLLSWFLYRKTAIMRYV